MKRIYLLVFVLFIAGAASAQNKKAKKAYNAAIIADTSGNLQQAIELYTKAINSYSKYAEAYLGRGTCRTRMSDTSGAANDYRKALQLNPKLFLGWYNLGCFEQQKGNDSLACIYFSQTIVLMPTFAHAYTNRGGYYYKTGDYERAIMDFVQAISINPDDDTTLFNLGLAEYYSSKFDKSFIHFNRSLEINPYNSDAFVFRGYSRLAMGDTLNAGVDFIRALNINAKNYRAIKGRGYVYLFGKDYPDAIADFTTYINNTGEKDPILLNDRSICYLYTEQPEKALQDMNAAIAICDTIPRLFRNRGSLYLETEQYPEARNDFKRALQLSRGNPVDYYYLALSEMSLAMIPEATEHITKAISIDSTIGEFYSVRGQTKLYNKDLNGALAEFKKAEALGFKSPYQYSRIAFIYLEKKEIRLADSVLVLCHNADTTFLPYYSLKALSLFYQKKFKECITYCNASLKHDSLSFELRTIRADAERLTGQYQRAIDDYTWVIGQENSLADLYYYRGCCYYSLSRNKSAKADFEEAVRLEPSNPNYQRALSQVK